MFVALHARACSQPPMSHLKFMGHPHLEKLHGDHSISAQSTQQKSSNACFMFETNQVIAIGSNVASGQFCFYSTNHLQ